MTRQPTMKCKVVYFASLLHYRYLQDKTYQQTAIHPLESGGWFAEFRKINK